MHQLLVLFRAEATWQQSSFFIQGEEGRFHTRDRFRRAVSGSSLFPLCLAVSLMLPTGLRQRFTHRTPRLFFFWHLTLQVSETFQSRILDSLRLQLAHAFCSSLFGLSQRRSPMSSPPLFPPTQNILTQFSASVLLWFRPSLLSPISPSFSSGYFSAHK